MALFLVCVSVSGLGQHIFCVCVSALLFACSCMECLRWVSFFPLSVDCDAFEALIKSADALIMGLDVERNYTKKRASAD